MCKNPGDSNYFQVLREEGDGEEKRSTEKKGVAREGEKKRKSGGEGYISSSSGSVKVCWLAIAVGQLILTPDHTPQPALKRQQPEKDTREGGQDECRMGTNHCMVRLLLNTVYNLFSGSSFFFNLCHSRMQNATDKVGDVMEKDRDKLNYHVCFAGKQIQRLWECKEIPWSCTHSHMCEDSSAVWERSFALETNLQVTSSQDTKPHSQLL